MDYKKLDKLISIPKKADASKQKKTEFYNELTELLKEEGYSKKAEEYLFSGFSLCGALPFFNYMKNSENKLEIYNILTRGDKFNNERIIALQIELNLLALIINDGLEEKEILKNILIKLPSISVSSKNVRFKDLNVFLRKRYVNVISENAVYPNIDDIGLKIINVKNIMKMFEDGFKNYTPKSDSEIKKIIDLNNWIRSSKLLNEENCKKDNCMDILEIKNSKHEEVNNIKNQNIDNLENEKIDNKFYIENNEKCKQALDDVMEFIMMKDNKISQYKDSINNLNRKKLDYERNISNLENKIIELNKKLEENQKEIEKLNNEKGSLNDKVNDLEECLAKKDQEIEDRKKINEITEKDNSKQYDEFINRVSKKVGLEYRDYKDAEDAEMTIDLGENMRIQLKTVFDILEEVGIKMK